MFGLMKNLIKDYTSPANAVKLTDLHAGCVVGFGFMPQKNISGKRIPVSEVNSYLFETDNFAAYRLENDNTDVNLIVANDDDPTGTYLALSHRINAALFVALFAEYSPHTWFALKQGDVLKAVASIPSAPQGWLTSRYVLAVKTSGRFLEGDYRLRKSADRTRLSKPFEYVLLVDEENEYALEAEKYEDGTLRVYATVYRPVTDIGEIAREPKSPTAPLITSVENNFMQPSKALLSGSIDKIAHVSPADSEKAAVPTPELKSVKNTPPVPTKMVEPSVEDKAEPANMAVYSKFGRIQPTASQPPIPSIADVLACDLKLAGKLIDEAQRNQMLLAELIRKVIDLPARINEQVLIPFTIDNAESAELARRYNLPSGDTAAVKEQIIEELKRFVGEKN